MSWPGSVNNIFRTHKSGCKRLNPKDSIGKRVRFDALNKKYVCCRPVRPARRVFGDALGPTIEAYLNGNAIADTSLVFVTFCMIGKTEETAAPMIIFSYSDKTTRKKLRTSRIAR